MLLNLLHTLTNMVKIYNENCHLFSNSSLEDQMVHAKDEYVVLQDALLNVGEKAGFNLDDIKCQLQDLFDGLSNIFHRQNKEILCIKSIVFRSN